MALTDDQVVSAVSAALEEAIIIAEEEDDWKVEKEKDGAVVKSKKNKEGRKVWLCVAEVPLPLKTLWEKLEDTAGITKWNSTLTEARVAKNCGDGVKVSYSVTTEGGGGIVSARDFVYGIKSLIRPDGVHVMGGMSVEIAEVPEKKEYVRAWHGPSCQILQPIEGEANKCKFVWLMDCDYKGMILSSIVELAMPVAQLQMVDCIKKLAG